MWLPRAVIAATGAMVLPGLVSPPEASAARLAIFVAPDGSDAKGCTRAAPCASFGRAYRAARPGQVVQVAGGSYPSQLLVRDPAKSARARKVVFRKARGARVAVAGLRLGRSIGSDDGPRNLAIRGIRIAGPGGRQLTVTAVGNTANVLLHDIDAANFYLNGVRDFTVRGGDWGPCTSTSTSAQSNEAVDGCSNSKIDGNAGNHDITIEHAVFHDYRIVPGSGGHFECMIVFGGTDITIRGNRFVDCEFYDIFVQHSSTHRMDGMRIENNWFHTPWNGRNQRNRPGAVAFSPRGRPFADVAVRRNSFVGTGLHLNEDGSDIGYAGFRVAGNIATTSWVGCYASATYRANIWTDRGCGATDRAGVFGYRLEGGRLRKGRGGAVVRRIVRALARGRTPARVARRLSRGAAAKDARWSAAEVRRIARDRSYLGRHFGAPGAHPALVSRRLWHAAQ